MKHLTTPAGVEQLTGREYFQLLCMGQEAAEAKAAELLAPGAGEPLNVATLGLTLTQEPDGTLLLLAGGRGASGQWHSAERRYDRSIVLLATDKTVYHEVTEPEEEGPAAPARPTPRRAVPVVIQPDEDSEEDSEEEEELIPYDEESDILYLREDGYFESRRTGELFYDEEAEEAAVLKAVLTGKTYITPPAETSTAFIDDDNAF